MITPDFQLIVEGENITQRIAPIFYTLSIVDQIGNKSDTLDLTIAYTGEFALPDTGATIKAEVGYRETGLWEAGTYVVSQRTVSGSRGQVTDLKIQAENMPTSPDGAYRSLQNSHNFAYFNKTFGEIVEHVCSRANLTAEVDSDVASIPMPMTSQFNESDAEFLYRISVFRDVVIKYNDSSVAFLRKDSGLLGSKAINLNTVLDFSYDLKDRTRFQKLIVPYQDKDLGEVQTLEYGDGQPVKRIRNIAPDKETAQEVATRWLKDLHRKSFEVSFTVPAEADIVAEKILSFHGFPDILPTDEYVLMSAKHNLSRSSFTTQCMAKVRG